MDDLIRREPATLAALQTAKVAAALEHAGLAFGEDGRLRAQTRTPDQSVRALLATILPDRFRLTRGRIAAEGAIGPLCDCLVVDRMVAHRIAPEIDAAVEQDLDAEEVVAANAVVGLYAVEPELSVESLPDALERLHETLEAAGFDPRKSCPDALLPGGVTVAAERGGLSPNPAFGVIALAHATTLDASIGLSRAIAESAKAGLNFDLAASLSGFLMLPLDQNGMPRLHSYDLPSARLHHSVFRARDMAERRRLIWRALGAVAHLADNASGRRMSLESFQQAFFAE